MSKKAKITTSILVAAGIAVAVILILVFTVFTGKKIKLSDYVTVDYKGVNNYATADVSIKKDDLYNALTDGENDDELKDLTKQYVDKLEAKTDSKDLANGNNFDIYFVQPEDILNGNQKLSDYINKNVGSDKFAYKAENIKEGEKTDIFSFVTVDIKGISPDATLSIVNSSDNELFKKLEYKADKTTNLSNGEMVTITCTSDIHIIADQGYVPASTETKIEINGLSTYVTDSGKITDEYKNKLNADNISMITNQTADKTFRMLYTATNNVGYLTQPNEETASDIKLSDVYFLKKKSVETENGSDNGETTSSNGDNSEETKSSDGSSAENNSDKSKEFDGPENKLYMVYSATVSNGKGTEKLYFTVEYDNIYIAANGSFGNTTKDITKSYKVSSNGEKLVNENVNSADNMKYYDIIKL